MGAAYPLATRGCSSTLSPLCGFLLCGDEHLVPKIGARYSFCTDTLRKPTVIVNRGRYETTLEYPSLYDGPWGSTASKQARVDGLHSMLFRTDGKRHA